MGPSPEERLLIDRYLKGELSGIELHEFMERIDADPDFRQEVVLQDKASSQIKILYKAKLKEHLLDYINYRKPRINPELRNIILFLLVLGTGVIIWNYPDYNAIKTVRKNLSLSRFKNSEQVKDASENTRDLKKVTEHQSGNQKGNNIEVISDSVSEIDGLTESEQSSADSVVITPAVGDGTFMVRQDELKETKTIRIQNLAEQTEQNYANVTSESSALDALNKMAHSSGLPPVESMKKSSESIEVEFWTSPVNYRGYKLSRSKLILFGIDESADVELLSFNEQLYLKLRNEYYLIRNNETFNNFQRVNKPETSFRQ